MSELQYTSIPEKYEQRRVSAESGGTIVSLISAWGGQVSAIVLASQREDVKVGSYLNFTQRRWQELLLLGISSESAVQEILDKNNNRRKVKTK